MSLESVKELRECMGVIKSDGSASKRKLVEITDAIEAEVAERFMELPVDADGVPVHIGDMLFYKPYNQTFRVGCVEYQYALVYVKDYANGSHWKPEECTHVKPRTVEDVVQEAIQWGFTYGKGGMDTSEQRDKFAAEIRELVKEES